MLEYNREPFLVILSVALVILIVNIKFLDVAWVLHNGFYRYLVKAKIVLCHM